MKKNIPYVLIFLPAALILSTSCASLKSTSAKKGFELSYKMNPGQSFTMKLESSSSIKTEQMGQEINVDIIAANETGFSALASNPDGTMNFEMEYKSMKQKATSSMGENSADYSSWIGKKVEFSLSPRGAVSNFKGFDKLPEISSATGEKITGDLTQRAMSNQYIELPDHPVKTGESWTSKNSTDIPYSGGQLKSEETNTYTVTEKVKMDGMDCLKIDATGVEKLTGGFEQQGTQLELTRETKSSGVIYYALDKGMYISMEYTSTGNSQIYVPAASITIPQEIKGKLSLKVVFD